MMQLSRSSHLLLNRTISYCIRTMSQATRPRRKFPETSDEYQESVSKKTAEMEFTKSAESEKIVEDASPDSTLPTAFSDAIIKSVKDLPAEGRSADIGFWKTERGLELKDQILTFGGRLARLFCSKERYDNLFESALTMEQLYLRRFNKGDENFLKLHGPESMMGLIIFNLGGAVKIRYDDRWVEDPRCMRTPKKKDLRLEGIDLRKSAINHLGLKYLSGTQHCRYLNVGDAKHFDDQAMACLHPLADSLEFLDVSGTSVTERGFGYLRLFHKLKFFNISRLEKARDLDALMSHLLEILPEGCVVLTNDETPSEMYGHPIPFRGTKSLRKDAPVLEGNRHIGNLMIYEKEMGALEFYRPEAIHELWMTPVMGSPRNMKIRLQQNLDNSWRYKLVKYIVKANNYKPLF